MNLTEALNILRHYQLWRLGDEITELSPKQITEAISVVISAAKWQQEKMYSEKDLSDLFFVYIKNNNMAQTAMQELINWAISLKDNEQQCVDWIVIKNKAEELLKLEKEQMHKCASFLRGKENDIEKPIFEIYYNENFYK